MIITMPFIHKYVVDGDNWIVAKPVVIVTDVFVVELQQINPILVEMDIKNLYFSIESLEHDI